jgi:hypothetical protein
MRRALTSAFLKGAAAAEAAGSARLYSTKPITATLFPGDGKGHTASRTRLLSPFAIYRRKDEPLFKTFPAAL